MSHILNGKNILVIKPEPGRPLNPIIETKTKTIIKETKSEIDINAIAQAVVKAMGGRNFSNNNVNDDFTGSNSMERMADIMSNISNKDGSNIDKIGIIKETKRDEKETNNTIDLLSQLGD